MMETSRVVTCTAQVSTPGQTATPTTESGKRARDRGEESMYSMKALRNTLDPSIMILLKDLEGKVSSYCLDWRLMGCSFTKGTLPTECSMARVVPMATMVVKYKSLLESGVRASSWERRRDLPSEE